MTESTTPSGDDGKTQRIPQVDGATQRLDPETLSSLSRDDDSPEGTVSQEVTPPKMPEPLPTNMTPAESKDAPASDASASDDKPEEEPFLVEHAGTQESDEIKDRVVAVLKTVYDPEIPVNIYELGMVYDIFVDGEARTLVRMTLTSPNCPVAGTLPGEVEEKVRETEGVGEAKVALVWDPPWSPDFMTEAAKLQLNMF